MVQGIHIIIIDTSVLFSAAYSKNTQTFNILEQIKKKANIFLFSPDFVGEEFKEKLKVKTNLTPNEINLLESELPIFWIDKEDYKFKLNEAKELIADIKDIAIVACSLLLNKAPIWTFDVKHFDTKKLKQSGVKTLTNNDIRSILRNSPTY